MPGRKLFINNSIYPLDVTLIIRSGPDPANTAGTQDVHLDPHEQEWVTYGTESDIYLNGLSLVLEAATPGFLVAEFVVAEFVVETRGSAFDDEMNMNDVVAISYQDGAFSFNGHRQPAKRQPMPAVTKENLEDALQQAINLELATIPTYLYTYYSIHRSWTQVPPKKGLPVSGSADALRAQLKADLQVAGHQQTDEAIQELSVDIQV